MTNTKKLTVDAVKDGDTRFNISVGGYRVGSVYLNNWNSSPMDHGWYCVRWQHGHERRTRKPVATPGLAASRFFGPAGRKAIERAVSGHVGSEV